MRGSERELVQASSRPSSAANTRRPLSRAIAHRSAGAQFRPSSELSMTVSTTTPACGAVSPGRDSEVDHGDPRTDHDEFGALGVGIGHTSCFRRIPTYRPVEIASGMCTLVTRCPERTFDATDEVRPGSLRSVRRHGETSAGCAVGFARRPAGFVGRAVMTSRRPSAVSQPSVIQFGITAVGGGVR